MGPVRKNRRARSAPPLPDLGSESAMLRALLSVFRHLELADQIRVLAEHAVSWSGLRVGMAFAPDENGRKLSPVAETLPETGPDTEAPKLEVSRLQADLGKKGEALYEGLPPFMAGWSMGQEPPGVSWALVMRGDSEAIAGLLLLLGDSAPEKAARDRVRQLLREARPAIANGIAVQATRALVVKDDTADCFNRRYFDEFLGEEMARASRFRLSLSLIFLDMDNLKDINSRYGHAMGSRTIYEVSQRVRNRIRKFDKLFRFGGDEFCIVLPETEWHGALEVAERVRESIAGRPLLVPQTGAGVKMTASFGISSFPLHARTREELIQRADWAMQRIKGGTKNSIAIAEITKPEAS